MTQNKIAALIIAACILAGAGAVHIFINPAAVVVSWAAQPAKIPLHDYQAGGQEEKHVTGAPGRPQVVQVTMTAYTASDDGKKPGHPAFGVTATGRHLTQADRFKVIAADPAYYPPGTKVMTPWGLAEVADTGDEDVTGPDRMDVFFGMGTNPLDVQDCWRWGRRELAVVVYQ